MMRANRQDDAAPTFLGRLKNLLVPSKTVIPSTSAAGRSLYAVIAIMCFLASIALGLSLSVRQTAQEYAKDLSGAVTIQIKPNDAADPNQQMAAVLTILQNTTGLYDINPLSADDAAALVEPYIGRGNLPADIAIPQIVAVRLDAKTAPDLDALGTRLAAEVPGASLNDHSRWKSRLLAFSSSLQGLSMAALALIVLAAISIVAFATRAAMAANQQIVEVLHLIGAKDRFIATEFQGHFVRLGLWSGLTGAFFAAITLILAGRVLSSGTEYFIPGLSLGVDAYFALLLVPVLSAIVAMVTARLTALSVVGRIL